MKYTLVFILVLINLFLQSQITVNGQDCECSQMLNEIIELTENDYALFQIKIEQENQNLYNTLKNVVIDSAKEKDVTSCQEIIQTYISFFNDGHLWAKVVSKENSANTIKYEEQTEIDSTI